MRGGGASEVVEYEVERPRHSGVVECVDEQGCVVQLPSATGAHEPTELLLVGPSLLGGLLLEDAERSEVSLSVDDLLHGGGTESSDQLVLQIGDAHVEPQPFQLGASEVSAEAGPFETPLEVALLCSVTEPRQPDVETSRAEQGDEAPDRPRASHRDDGDTFSLKIAPMAYGERLECGLVAGPFDEDDRTRFDDCSLNRLLVIHNPPCSQLGRGTLG